MLSVDDTIAAIASARGGPRGIVRLSGPGTHGVIARICSDDCPDRSVFRTLLRLPASGGRDSPVASLPVSVMLFHTPRSYTGQDSAEILTVGNPAVLERVLGVLLDSGARRATPGEFSARAYLHGKLSIEQAEGIAARIAASRDSELEAAERVRTGDFGSRCLGWSDRVADLLALVEAGIDFTDQEDVVAIPADELAAGLDALLGELDAELGGEGATEAETGMPSVVLIGPPNAGKSTLFNALVGGARSVVSDRAGTTRDAIAETIEIGYAGGGERVRLIDLPGLDADAGGRGSDADRAAQEAAVREIASASLLIACDPAGLFESLRGLDERRALRVITKADLPHTQGSDRGSIAVCALDGWHLEQLREAIADHAVRDARGDGLIPRHRRALAAARSGIALAHNLALGDGGLAEPEMVASLLRSALDEIGSVSGRIAPDAVLGRVFASFCVGK